MYLSNTPPFYSRGKLTKSANKYQNQKRPELVGPGYILGILAFEFFKLIPSTAGESTFTV